MIYITFEWDSWKARRNQLKHRVSFEEAESVFSDEAGVLIHDPGHSDEEDRFLLLGMSSKLRLLVISHTYRKSDDVIRLISARRAMPSEYEQYGGRK